MMTVKIVSVGTLKESYWRQACAEYEKRLGAFCSLRLVEVKETNISKEKDILINECEGYVMALCVEGEQYSSPVFSKKLEDLAMVTSKVTFIIGSSCGLDPAVKERADCLLSFSHFTFPHQMMRVVLLEQIYRAFSIARNTAYHK